MHLPQKLSITDNKMRLSIISAALILFVVVEVNCARQETPCALSKDYCSLCPGSEHVACPATVSICFNKYMELQPFVFTIEMNTVSLIPFYRNFKIPFSLKISLCRVCAPRKGTSDTSNSVKQTRDSYST